MTADTDLGHATDDPLEGAMIRGKVTEDNLNDVMEFGHVILVHEDGTVTEPPDVFAPELDDGELSGPREWQLMNGYSGQQSYRGPIMHPSEFIGGRLARDILAQPGYYVALVATSLEEDGDTGETVDEGWAVASRPVDMADTDLDRDKCPSCGYPPGERGLHDPDGTCPPF